MEVSESSSSFTSTEPPPFDHQQSANSIHVQLDAISLEPQNDANNNGDRYAAHSEETENEQSLQEEKKEVDKVTNLIENEQEDEIDKEKEFEVVNENEDEIEKEKEFGEVGEGEGEKSRRIRFPVRPEAEDCSFYLRTGMCKFGMNCKFNHPPDRKSQPGKVKRKEDSLHSTAQKVKEKDDSKTEQVDCKYFDRPGGCKFGKACKFNHSRKSTTAAELNFMGLPIRPGERECPYYMRNGSCKFGANCKFNHPDPTSLGGSNNHSGHSNGGSILSPNVPQSALGSWSPAALSDSPPYVPLMFQPTQGVPSQPEWHAYQVPVYSPERSLPLASAYATKRQPLERNVYTHQQQQILGDEFPERPGKPECSYFLKTGNCKFRSACKFHHPKNESAKSTSCALSESGLPLRPGQSVCSHYSRYGICKFGPACKYDHPVNYAHSPPMAAEEVDEASASGDSTENDQPTVPAAEIGSENPIH